MKLGCRSCAADICLLPTSPWKPVDECLVVFFVVSGSPLDTKCTSTSAGVPSVVPAFRTAGNPMRVP